MIGRKSVPMFGRPWFKSGYSSSSVSCVEVRFAGDAVLVRDSKNRADSPILAVATTQWAAFIDGLADRP
ncbi:MAG: DUF397 domain-containing protein [Pseudonocardiaceae bacterium]